MVAGMAPVTAFAGGGGALNGSGTASDPYLIEDAADLEAFRDKVNGGDKGLCAKLTADITLTGDWNPISSNATYTTDAYAGTFDGDGHTISGLKISNVAVNQGLFAFINGATIQNLKVNGTISCGTKNYIGGIVGKMQSGTISKCSFSGSVTGGYAGGIVGALNSASVTIQNCSNTADVTGTFAGGILGYWRTSATIENCYNTGKIVGTTKAAGIAGQLNNGAITNCYNIGEISGNSDMGGIYAFCNKNVTNCYYLYPSTESLGTSTAPKATKIESTEGLADKLGDAFTTDTSGNVILKWEASGEPVEKNPRIVISGDSTLFMTNSGAQPEPTLTVAYKDMDDTPTVAWTADNDCVTLEEPENASESNNTVIVHAAKPGTVKIKAVAGDYNDEFTMSIVPYVTTVEIKNVNQPGAVAVGQTVQAQVNIWGGDEYDYENYPKLSYQWYRYNVSTAKSEAISGATNRTYEIKTDSFEDIDQKNKIGVNVTCNGTTVHSYNDQQESVRSSDYGKLYPVAYDKNFPLPTDIKKETTLTLPTVHTKDGETANITWSSSEVTVTDNEVKITLPESGKKEIKLSAKFTLDGTETYANRSFTINVWSKAAQEVDANETAVADAASKLNNMGALTPKFGTDSNILTMLRSKLNNDSIAVEIESIKKTNATTDESGIAENGDITYFYTDPNTVPLQRNGTYSVTLKLTCGSASKEASVSVVLGWDADKVKNVMRQEILNKVTVSDTVDADFDLPKVVDGKKWTQIDWQSSDAAITVSDKNQQTADTLFDPYVGVVACQSTDKVVTLTAAFHFQYADSDTPITLYKTFEVTVKGDPNAADRAEKYQEKLDTAVADAKLDTDNITGDIQLPTTRDMQLDGKYTPVIITSSDPDVIEAPETPNSARVSVYRPLPGEDPKTVTLTMKIVDRPAGPQDGEDVSKLPVLATKDITVIVQPLTQDEINAEIDLMDKAKAAYWDGIRSANTDKDNVTTDLHAFTEYTEDGSWVYSSKDMTGSGIIPVALDNWYDQQIWRLFRSSNADVVSHENLLVTRQEESKAVTITSYLSSETLGKYAEKYPDNADFQKLYKQPVTAELVVTGTKYDSSTQEERAQAAVTAKNNRSSVKVSFTLTGSGMGFTESDLKYAEGSTVFDVFSDMLAKHGYTCKRRGSYIASITSDNGTTLGEFDEGKNSGWMYRVNGTLPDKYMSSQSLKDGDAIEVFFTSDYTHESGSHGGSGSATTPTTPTTPEKPSASELPFKDVSTTAWYYTAVNYAYLNKLLTGTSADTFTPDGTLTRGMAVTVLYRLSESPAVDGKQVFTDVAVGQWYAEAVSWAAASDIVAGVGNNKFAPQLNITREQLATILYRYAKAMKYDESGRADLSKYTDAASVSSWAADAVQWAVENALISGTSETTLSPNTTATRAQFAVIMQRFCELSAKK